MKHFLYYFRLGWPLIFCVPSPAQNLAVNLDMNGHPAPLRLAKQGTPGFIADHFQVGERGEIWIVDAIRTWATADANGAPGRKLPALFQKLTLFGGIEAPPPEPAQPPQPECDCHNLMTIKSATAGSATSDVRLSSADGGLWQVDFQNLHWSIPGGMPIQFGIMGVSASGDPWYNYAAESGGVHELKAFDDHGKLEGPLKIEGQAVNSGIALRLQVWAHKTAPVAIHLGGQVFEVVLRSDGSFDAAKADPETLRFGPKNAIAVGSRLETIDGRAAVIANFRRADSGIERAGGNACLVGRQQDGVLFEGCDTVQKK
jgi:hypothetical protein